MIRGRVAAVEAGPPGGVRRSGLGSAPLVLVLEDDQVGPAGGAGVAVQVLGRALVDVSLLVVLEEVM